MSHASLVTEESFEETDIASPGPARRSLAVLARVGPVVLVGFLVLAAWQAATSLGLLSAELVSQPGDVAVRVWATLTGEVIYGKTIWFNLGVTAKAISIGYLIGSASGIVVGCVLGRAPFVAAVVAPYIRALAALPKIAVVPLLVLIFGIGVKAEAANVVLMVFIIVVFSTFSGAAMVNEELINAARVMGASRWTVTFRIVLPASLPAILSGLRAGVPFAFIGAITSEFIAASSGLGWMMQQATSQYDPTGLFTGLVYLTAFVLCLVQLLRLAENRLLRWQRR